MRVLLVVQRHVKYNDQRSIKLFNKIVHKPKKEVSDFTIKERIAKKSRMRPERELSRISNNQSNREKGYVLYGIKDESK